MALWTARALCFACLLVTAVCAEFQMDPPPPGPYRIPLNKWTRNHTYSASTDGPMAKALNSSAPFRNALAVLTGHFRNESERAYALLQRPSLPFVEERVRACNLPDKFSHIEAVNTSTSQYGWGVLGPPCTTELDTNLNDSVVHSMHVYLTELKKVASSVARAANMNWGKAVTFMEFKYAGDFESCQLLHFVAFRVNGLWRVNTGLTNAEVSIYKEEWHRHYLVEMLHIVNGSVAPTPLTLPERPLPNRPLPTGWVKNSLSLLATWGGSPATSIFRHTMYPVDNPAVRAAIKIGEDTKEQVQDATTKSNIMILMFPLFLALIPLALFADASTAVTVGYTIVTDILSAMPLAIKGKELMDFGRRHLVGARTWVYGGRTRMDLAASETWHATCRADRRIIAQGRLFMGLAVGMMVLGMALEIFCKRGLKGKKRVFLSTRRREETMQLWEGSLCSDCRCGTGQFPGIDRETVIGFS